MTTRQRTAVRALALVAVVALSTATGCGDADPKDTTERGSLLVPSHDLALFFIRECELSDARLIAEQAARELPSPEDRAKLLAHVDLLSDLTRIGAASVTSGPLADGCVRRFFGPPFRNRTPKGPWRPPDQVIAIADTLRGLERAGLSLVPAKPPSEDPRYTYELAALLSNLDQYARVDTLLAAIPASERGAFWYRFIAAITTVRREVATDWRNYDACHTAVDSLNVLLDVCDADEELSAHACLVLFDLAMIERHMHRHHEALAYLNRALTDPVARGQFREYISQTWTRF